MKLLKIIFVLKLLYSDICAQDEVYDNSVLMPTNNQNITSCRFVQTEHFVIDKTDTSARMHLSTEKLFQTILNDLEFLVQMEPKSVTVIDDVWFTEDSFKTFFVTAKYKKLTFLRQQICAFSFYTFEMETAQCVNLAGLFILTMINVHL